MEVDNYCYCCGKANPHGMQLEIERKESGEASTCYTPPDYVQGYQGVVHGGILSTLLDEIMAHAILADGPVSAATARMEVTFRKPARTGEPLQVLGKVEEAAGRRIRTSARILNSEDKIVAEATALFIRIKPPEESRST